MVQIRHKENEIKTKKEDLDFLLKETNKLWNSCNCSSVDKIGSLVIAIMESKCKTYDQWEDYFFNKLNGQEKVIFMYKEFGKILKENNIECTQQELIDLILIRTLYETWIGYKAEEETKKWLSSQEEVIGVRKSTPNHDYEQAIDFVVFLKNNVQIGVQVKPISFFVNCTFIGNEKAKALLGKMKQFNGLDVFIVMVDDGKVTDFSKSQYNRYKQYWLKGEKKRVS